MSREHFDQQLRLLQDDLLQLASRVESAISRSIAALLQQNFDKAQRVIADDDIIDRQQYAVEDDALLLIARQAPVAADLRLISAVIAIASELERMGDYAEGIAKLTIRGANQPLPKLHINISRLAEKAEQILRDAVDTVVSRDVDAARRLSAAEGEIDRLVTQAQTALLLEMLRDPQQIEPALHLVFVVHNLERIADRATNIGERLIFLITGELIDLND